MESFPHAIQVLNDKYAQLNTLILERSKIDTTIAMVQQDIGKCLSSTSSFVADAPTPGTQSGSTVIQSTVEAPTEAPKEAPKTQTKPKPKAAEPKPEEKPTEVSPKPEETVSEPVQPTEAEAAPEVSVEGEVTTEDLKDKMAELTKAGKAQKAFALVQTITKTPLDATPEERVRIMEAFNSL